MLSVISAKGKDVRSLLQRLTTNQLLVQQPAVVDNLFADMNGRVLLPAQMWWLGTYGDWLCVHEAHVDRLMSWLDQMTFREDVEFQVRPDLVVAQSVMRQPVAFSCDEHQAERSRPIGSLHLVEKLVSKDRALDAPPADAWRYDAFQSGEPALFVADLALNHNPHEAGLHVWLNDRKGCYTGQEVIARLETYNKVQRELVVHAVEGGAASSLMIEQDVVGDVVGTATREGAPTLLAAYVKRAAAQRDSFFTNDGRITKRVPKYSSSV